MASRNTATLTTAPSPTSVFADTSGMSPQMRKLGNQIALAAATDGRHPGEVGRLVPGQRALLRGMPEHSARLEACMLTGDGVSPLAALVRALSLALHPSQSSDLGIGALASPSGD